MAKQAWSRKLARPITLKDGTRIVTLSDARRAILAIEPQRQRRNEWQSAASWLMRAAESGRDIEVLAATLQLELAAFLNYMLKLDGD